MRRNREEGGRRRLLVALATEYYKDKVWKVVQRNIELKLAEADGKQSYTDLIQTRDLCVGPNGFHIHCDVRTSDGHVLPVMLCDDSSDDGTDGRSTLRTRVNKDDIW